MFSIENNPAKISYSTILEIESQTETNLPLTERAARNEKVGSGVVDKRRAEIKYRRVENVVEFNDGTQTHSFGQAKLTRNVQIESIKRRSFACVARQIAAASADRRKRKLVEQRLVESAGLLPDDVGKIAGKIRAVGAEIVEITVAAADADAERRGAAGAEKR